MQTEFEEPAHDRRDRQASGYAIPERAHFDREAAAYFVERIKSSRVYLEYGSGGSTIQAAGHVQRLYTVDSDSWFLNAVRRKLAEKPRQADCHLLHADIGRAPRWALPPEPRSVPDSWRAYAWGPWQRLWRDRAMPDIILVDGRFRLACALASLIHLREHSGTQVLVDDYTGRPHYHALEKWATLLALHGSMAVFTLNPAISVLALDAALRCYEADWR